MEWAERCLESHAYLSSLCPFWLCNPRKAQSMRCFTGQYEKGVSQTRVLEQLGLQVVLFGKVIEPLGGGSLEVGFKVLSPEPTSLLFLPTSCVCMKHARSLLPDYQASLMFLLLTF